MEVFDPKKYAVPLGVVCLAFLAIMGWYKVYSDNNSSVTLAVSSIAKDISNQNEKIASNRSEITDIKEDIDRIERDQNDIKTQILERLSAIEQALGIKKKD